MKKSKKFKIFHSQTRRTKDTRKDNIKQLMAIKMDYLQRSVEVSRMKCVRNEEVECPKKIFSWKLLGRRKRRRPRKS